MKMRCGSACVAVLALMAGCGGREELKQFQREITPEVAHADSMRSLIATLQGQLKSEGIPGVKTALLTLDERLEEYKDSGVGEKNRAAYDTIISKLKDLAAKVKDGKATRPALQEQLQELESLAGALPKGASPAAGSKT